MANICVIGGAGYVGLTTGACFADLGNTVVGLDINHERVAQLQKGILPIYEPGLEELVQRNLAAGRLRFSADYADALGDAEFAFITVDTPSSIDGGADLNSLRSAAEQIARTMRRSLIIVNKSTVPVGAGDLVTTLVEQHRERDVEFRVVSNPEFLQEGLAVHGCLHPDRIILGSADRAAAEQVAELYQTLNAPILITDLRTAEMIKYASNSFLAAKISFINEIAAICEQLGADVKEVARGMGLDKRIGGAFLDAGVGWGGSCFPKDVRALEYMAATHGCHPQLLRAVMDINRDARRRLVQRTREALGGTLDGKRVAVLGLSFKENTDDMRDAPSVTVIHQMQNEGARVVAYDPVAGRHAPRLLPHTEVATSAYEATRGAEALVILTAWNEFKQLDLERVKILMANPLIVDGRNIYDSQRMHELGFHYLSVGRPTIAREVAELTS
ncbi:MAG TPA: UDP-glucose/GDP-mannose dehydrogenase family protein [Chloroflexota bacterium]|nr:UDP-glucose/GDP-mannose dehydrogenase family protein [Chloroflexota bacterium]